MYCKNCGKELMADAKFCMYCGTRVDIVPTRQVEEVIPEPVVEPVVQATNEAPAPVLAEELETVERTRPVFDEIDWNVSGYPDSKETVQRTEDVDFNWNVNPDDIPEPIAKREYAEKPQATAEPVPEFAESDIAEGLFGGGNKVPEELSAAERIDKFYTFNKKNEEFQQLLNQEYDKVKSGNAIGQEMSVADAIAEERFESRNNRVPSDMDEFLEAEGIVKPYQPKAFESDVLQRIEAQEAEKARLKAEEEARLAAIEQARAEAEAAKAKAEEEARKKAEAIRAKAEAEAREAKRLAEEARVRAAEEARIKAELEAKMRAEEEAKRQAEEEARKKAEAVARYQAEEAARIKAEEELKAAQQAAKIKAQQEAKQAAEARERYEASRRRRLLEEAGANEALEASKDRLFKEANKTIAEEEARKFLEQTARMRAEEAAKIREAVANLRADFGAPVVEEPIVEAPVVPVEAPVVPEPIVEEPIVEEPIVEEPSILNDEFDDALFKALEVETEAPEPVIEEFVFEPVVEEPVVEEPVVAEPIVEESVFEAPVEAPINEEIPVTGRDTMLSGNLKDTRVVSKEEVLAGITDSTIAASRDDFADFVLNTPSEYKAPEEADGVDDLLSKLDEVDEFSELDVKLNSAFDAAMNEPSDNELLPLEELLGIEENAPSTVEELPSVEEPEELKLEEAVDDFAFFNEIADSKDDYGFVDEPTLVFGTQKPAEEKKDDLSGTRRFDFDPKAATEDGATIVIGQAPQSFADLPSNDFEDYGKAEAEQFMMSQEAEAEEKAAAPVVPMTKKEKKAAAKAAKQDAKQAKKDKKAAKYEDYDDEEEEVKKGGAGKVILIILLILLSLVLVVEVVGIGVHYVAPQSKIAEMVDSQLNKVIHLITGDETDYSLMADQRRTGFLADNTELIEAQADKNYNGNIQSIVYNKDLNYETTPVRSNTDLVLSTPITEVEWGRDENNYSVYYDEEVIGTAIAYESQKYELMKSGDESVLSLVSRKSTQETLLEKKNSNPGEFTELQIGEIRTSGSYYYIWISETIGGTTTQRVLKMFIKEKFVMLVQRGYTIE